MSYFRKNCSQHLTLEKLPYVYSSCPEECASLKNESSTTPKNIASWKPGKVTEVLESFKKLKGVKRINQNAIQPLLNSEIHKRVSLNITQKDTEESIQQKNSNEEPISENSNRNPLFRRFRPPSKKMDAEVNNFKVVQSSDLHTSNNAFNGQGSSGLFSTVTKTGKFASVQASFTSIPQKNVQDVTQETPKFQTFNGHYSANLNLEQNKIQNPFKTAKEQLITEEKARGIKRTLPSHCNDQSKEAPKVLKRNSEDEEQSTLSNETIELMKDERLKNVEPKMVEAILNEVIESGAETDWDDIAGLTGVKGIIREVIIWPMLRPDLFTGLRGPPKGILLFGPPGTGKTMFGRLIATMSESTFFNISASSLMSKWCGDGEKMVRALFQVARVRQPAVIFIDEIDSILTQRSDSEHESSRRLKTEFLIQFDGCGTKSEDKILVIGVTNRPQELDEAARRRLVKRIYIPLPDSHGRQQIVRNLMKGQNNALSDEDYSEIAKFTSGYSGADMASLCKEAAYGPIRDLSEDIRNVHVDQVRPIQLKDFQFAKNHVKASVASTDLIQYENWDKQFGCHV